MEHPAVISNIIRESSNLQIRFEPSPMQLGYLGQTLGHCVSPLWHNDGSDRWVINMAMAPSASAALYQHRNVTVKNDHVLHPPGPPRRYSLTSRQKLRSRAWGYTQI